MDIDFGYGSNRTTNEVVETNEKVNPNESEEVTNLTTGKIETKEGTEEIIDNFNNNSPNNNNPDNNNTNDNNIDNNNNNDIKPGTTIEVGEDKYTIDDKGNAIDKDGNIFKNANELNDWLKEFEQVTESEEININNIQNAINVEILDDNDKPVEFENSIEGIKAYVNAVVETAKDEHYQTAINTLYQKYPILNDVLNYYIANGNSLDGFNEMPDRSNITINDTDEAQQETIIKTAWKEQGRKGDVEGYIQYLKSSGTLLATAQEELEGLQEADKQQRQQLAEEAERKENERLETLQNYWNGVHDVIKNRNIAGYQIPESIVVNRNGQKISVTPEDFFTYLYRVDEEGYSAYERDLAKDTPESRRDDEILRAYLKFVGGNYSNLVEMAINREQVNKLKFRAKENRATARITPPTNTNNKNNIDFGYN